MTDDFFRSRLDGMIDPRHPLAVLGDKLPWSKLEASIAPITSRPNRWWLTWATEAKMLMLRSQTLKSFTAAKSKP